MMEQELCRSASYEGSILEVCMVDTCIDVVLTASAHPGDRRNLHLAALAGRGPNQLRRESLFSRLLSHFLLDTGCGGRCALHQAARGCLSLKSRINLLALLALKLPQTSGTTRTSRPTERGN